MITERLGRAHCTVCDTFLPYLASLEKKGARSCPQDLLPKPGREINPVSIRCSQTAQLEGEAKSPGSRQVRGRLGLELPRPGRGKAGARAIAQLRATLWGQLVLSVPGYQCTDRRGGGSPRRPSCRWLQSPPWTLFRPVPSLQE